MNNKYCEICDGDLEVIDSGIYRGIVWRAYKCIECDTVYSEEPDYDLLKY